MVFEIRIEGHFECWICIDVATEYGNLAVNCCWFFVHLPCQHGGDVNAADHTGQTALHWSAVRGAIQVAELLLQEGSRVNVADMYGYQVGILVLFVLSETFTYV